MNPLPQWIKAENGDLFNVRLISALILEEASEYRTERFVLTATIGRKKFLLAEFDNQDRAIDAFRKLEDSLEIAVLDMDLDIIAPLEREANQEEAQ